MVSSDSDESDDGPPRGAARGPHARPSPPKWVPDGVREAQARNRALTREVGALREAARQEGKKRERAQGRTRQLEQQLQEAEQVVRELRYSNKRLSRELAATKESARKSNARNRGALAALREGLGSVEDMVARRSAESFQQMQAIFAQLQGLQGRLFQVPDPADPGAAPPLSAAAAPGVQQALAELMRSHSVLSGLLTGADSVEPAGRTPPAVKALLRGADEALRLEGPANGAAPTEAAGSGAGAEEPGLEQAIKVRALEERLHEVEEQNRSLLTEVNCLQKQALAAPPATPPATPPRFAGPPSPSPGAGFPGGDLIQQYRLAVSKAKAQVRALHDRLESSVHERTALREEIDLLKRAMHQREAVQTQRLSDAAGRATEFQAVLQEKERDLQEVQEKFDRDFGETVQEATRLATALESTREALEMLKGEYEKVLAHNVELEELSVQQKATIADLHAAVASQREDIRSALQLVGRGDTRAPPAGAATPPAGGASVASPGGAAPGSARSAGGRAAESGGDPSFGSLAHLSPSIPIDRDVYLEAVSILSAKKGPRDPPPSAAASPADLSGYLRAASPLPPPPAPLSPLHANTLGDMTPYGQILTQIAHANAFPPTPDNLQRDVDLLDKEIQELEQSVREATEKFMLPEQ